MIPNLNSPPVFLKVLLKLSSGYVFNLLDFALTFSFVIYYPLESFNFKFFLVFYKSNSNWAIGFRLLLFLLILFLLLLRLLLLLVLL